MGIVLHGLGLWMTFQNTGNCGEVKLKRNYYILNDGRLRRKDNTFLYEKYSDKGEVELKKTIPIETVDSFFCYGENDFNSKFFNFLSENGIVLHLFNYYGYYSGTFYPREKLVAGDVLLRQAAAYLSEEDRMYFAYNFIESAQFHILQNLKERRDLQPLQKIITKIERESNHLKSAITVNELMTIEAKIRKLYYSSWDHFLDWEDPFISRTKQPPQNSINALISFGNSLMYSVVLGEIYKTQLNPTISYLHEPGVRRYSLALDIAEIFKPFIVDRLIFRLINKKMLKLEEFDKDLNCCYLGDTGKKIFLREWEKQLSSTIKHRQLGRNVSYKRLIRLELYKMIKHLLGEKKYKVFHRWW